MEWGARRPRKGKDMQGTKLLNTMMMIPRTLSDSGAESVNGRLFPVDTFIGTESIGDNFGQVTLSFDIEECRRSADGAGRATPLAVLLCSADARALGKALLESADVAERLAEETRIMRQAPRSNA